ncbi:Uncharacterised protein [Mycobacterium tuberculosis]|nr:Uncharacterised protein [Mycobacterium tuberculosis]CKP66852.1 Uncharacterised protein [Mycobacterium tuberculosis]CNT90374.1 Uncharacterised protein [Mycobacterium tuberculosis]CNV68125.1 Uncharacterised protein [Mycobacterium tuberculosis]COU91001.1 Uncharacterised protein [Mycobacterium tuberculosis]
MIASGRNGPPTTTPSGNTYSASLFIIAVCGFAAASALCRAIDARLLKYVAMPAKIITGTPTAINAGRLKSTNASNPDRCVMYAPIGAPNKLASRKWPTSTGLKT